MSSLCFTTRHLHGHLPPRTRGVPRGMRLRATRLRLEHGPERGRTTGPASSLGALAKPALRSLRGCGRDARGPAP